MAYIIIVDHRSNNEMVSCIMADDECEEVAIYGTLEEAEQIIREQFLAKSFPCLIVDLDDRVVK